MITSNEARRVINLLREENRLLKLKLEEKEEILKMVNEVVKGYSISKYVDYKEGIKRLIGDFETKRDKILAIKQRLHNDKQYEMSVRADVRANTFNYAIDRLRELL